MCGGIGYEPIPNQPDGTLALDDLVAGLPDDPTDSQFALPAVICLENTQNRCGGAVLPLPYQADVAEFARERGLAVHLDGARIFNASVALGQPAAEITKYADSVQFCLSKGLRAPIGSMVAGAGEFIATVRRIRKMLGGGMRQAGVIAAAGIIALEEMVDRLTEDHELARRLARGLAGLPGIRVDPWPQTNIVLFTVVDPRFTPESFVAAAGAAGVRVGGFGHGRLRAVTHADLTATDIADALDVVERLLAAGGPAGGATPGRIERDLDACECYVSRDRHGRRGKGTIG